MTLFDPYSHARVHELRQERLARKARLRERIGFDTHGTAGSSGSAPERVVAAIARLSGRRSSPQRPQTGSVRSALDS